jgi:autotransporter-associated beta strand protein
VDGVTPVAGAINFTYSPILYPTAQSTAPYAEVGTYIVTATFTSQDPNYGGNSVSGAIVNIVPAAPTIVINSGPFGYSGSPQPTTAVAYGVDGVTPVDGTFSFTYNGSTTPPTAPGIYTVAADFTPTPNPYVAWLDYKETTATGTMTILPNGVVTIQSGAQQGGIIGPLSVVKSGAGTATLDAPNNYTAGTYVTGGVLIVTDPKALPDGGALTIGSDAPFAPAPAPVAAAAMPASAAVIPSSTSSSSGTSSTGTTNAQVSVSIHDQALMLHLTVNNRSAASVVIPFSSLGIKSSDDPNFSRDIALLMRMTMTT